jgi:hypothetical protein
MSKKSNSSTSYDSSIISGSSIYPMKTPSLSITETESSTSKSNITAITEHKSSVNSSLNSSIISPVKKSSVKKSFDKRSSVNSSLNSSKRSYNKKSFVNSFLNSSVNSSIISPVKRSSVKKSSVNSSVIIPERSYNKKSFDKRSSVNSSLKSSDNSSKRSSVNSSLIIPERSSDKRTSVNSSKRSSVIIPERSSDKRSFDKRSSDNSSKRSSLKVNITSSKKDSLKSSDKSSSVKVIYVNYNKRHSYDRDLNEIKKIIPETIFNKSRFSSVIELLRDNFDKDLKTLNDIRKFLYKRGNTDNFEFFIKIKSKNGNYIYYNINYLDSITEELLSKAVLVDDDNNEIRFNNLSLKSIFYLDKRYNLS